ncbi:MAG: YegS/Rv2252/BmrU family lipid kinase [Ruminococcaceae bacterium]|nr:YegS/Rv2252/BmrU family lipid kinase [Oscillospiraceae bacterium]
MKRLLLTVNPVAGKGRGKTKLFEATDIFTKNGYRVTVLPTSPKGTEKVIQEEAENFDLVVAIGGDGTLNSVASGIIKSESNVPMGYIPLGSTNDFGFSLGLTKNVANECQRICESDPRFIDVGRLDDRYFVYIACAGLFAGASYMTSQQLKNAIGHSAYVLKGFLELAEFQRTNYRVEFDGEVTEDDYLYVGISNTLRAGGIFNLPKDEVSFDDGFFELTLIKNPSKITDRVALTNDFFNSNLNSKYFFHKKIEKAIIYSDTPKGWSLDGENGGERSKVSFEVVKRKLNFIY